METKINSPRTRMLRLGAARSHARLARQLALTSSRPSSGQFTFSSNFVDSLWSPLRLDLLKTPVTRLRD